MDFHQINERLPIQSIPDSEAVKRGIDLRILRLDQTHPEISGNKWFKLKYNLLQARQAGHSKLLTFGGAYSNHIHAVAGASHLFGFESIGIIRGEEHTELNPTLSFAKEHGMILKYVDRESYRKKTEASFIEGLRKELGDFYLIPEGGTNELAIKGAAEISSLIHKKFDYYCLPVGTGGTIASLITGLQNHGRIIGFSALKGSFLTEEVSTLLGNYTQQKFGNWEINNDYHFGGYAKVKPELIEFIREMESDFDLPLDPVYTGKMMYGLVDLIRKGVIPKGAKVLAIHTGGLQGRRGFGL